MRNKGFTLLELLIVLAISAILVGVLLVAIQRARNSGDRATCLNREHQLSLGILQFESAHPGFLPSSSGDKKSHNSNQSVHSAVAPYMGLGRIDDSRTVKPFVCPVDKTVAIGETTDTVHGWTSYAVNGMVFNGVPKPSMVTDGMSNTMAVAEHYAFFCHNAKTKSLMFFYASTGKSIFFLASPTFADLSRGDYGPETTGTPPASRNPFGFTFQLQPPDDDCDPHLAQTSHSEGMTIALCDGSVKTISRSIAQEVYWALVTPSGGEP